MAIGLAASPVANNMLDLFGNATSAGWSTPFVQLHTADPGSAGTTAIVSPDPTRKALAFSAASGGSKAAIATFPSWTAWASGTETITHLSIWTASTSGTFLGSVALTASKVVNDTDTLNITALTLSITTLAA